MLVQTVLVLSIGVLSGLFSLTGVTETTTGIEATGIGHEEPPISIDELDPLAEMAPNSRYGVSARENTFLDELRVGWIRNFGPDSPEDLQEGIEFVGVVTVFQDKLVGDDGRVVERYPTYRLEPSLDYLAGVLDKNPGRLWIIGNEPDRAVHQGDTQAYVMAKAYHDVYHFIKQHDPSAQVAPPGLVGVTPARLQYLDMLWNSYESEFGNTMPVDVWTFHVYILPEVYADGRWSNAGKALGTDLDLAILDADGDASLCSRDDVYCKAEHDSITVFADQVVAMRTWMKTHGEQEKPLVLTEFGLLFPYQLVDGECTVKDEYGQCFTPQRSADFMVKAYEYLENAKDADLGYALDDNRMVQRWMWFSMPYPRPWASWNPSLWAPVDMSALTIVGQTHISAINKQPLEQNLVLNPTDVEFTGTATVGQPVTLSVPVYNNGNTTINTPVNVTFYANQARTKEIGTATIPGGIDGGARRGCMASVTWNEALQPGWNFYWVVVDPDHTINGSSAPDKAAKGKIFMASHRLYLPTLMK